jgi:hypothetical protein
MRRRDFTIGLLLAATEESVRVQVPAKQHRIAIIAGGPVAAPPFALRFIDVGGIDRGPTSSGSNRFAIDSPLEGPGFEPSVPQ